MSVRFSRGTWPSGLLEGPGTALGAAQILHDTAVQAVWDRQPCTARCLHDLRPLEALLLSQDA